MWPATVLPVNGTTRATTPGTVPMSLLLGLASKMSETSLGEMTEMTSQSSNTTIITSSHDPFLEDDVMHLAPPLLFSHPTTAVAYLSVTSLAMFLGTFGNILLLVVFFCTHCRGYYKAGNEFLINLAFADLCVAAIADPLCIIGAVKGEAYFAEHPWLCEGIASFCLAACICSFFSLTGITLNRYIYICHNAWYEKIYTKWSSLAMCVLFWGAAFLCEMPNFLGWGGHVFDDKNHSCIWDRTASFTYTLFVAIFLIMVPLLGMGSCYIAIFTRIWKSGERLKKHNPNHSSAKTFRTVRTLLIIFTCFVICWTPYAWVVLLDVKNTFSFQVHLWVTLLAHFHSAINCTIFLTSNKEFRTRCKAIFISKKHWPSFSSTSRETIFTGSKDNVVPPSSIASIGIKKIIPE